jgi:cytochrome P450
VVDFNWFDFETQYEDLQLQWDKLRRRVPQGIFWTPQNGGHWVPLRGEDVAFVLTDHSRFSAHDTNTPPKPEDMPRVIPNEIDPPRHTEFRKIILPSLMSKRLQPVEDRAREITISLIDELVGSGECEFIEDFASKLPLTVFLEFVELPVEDGEMLKALADQMIASHDLERSLEAQQALASYLMLKLHERQANPGTDLLSLIANAEVFGRKIEDSEALLLTLNVLLGGLDTVVNMLGFFALFFARNPGHRRQLLDDPRLIPGAVEELIRRYGLVANARRTVQDTTINGVQLKAGDMVVASTLLYGIDPSIHDDPLTVDFKRGSSSSHLTFGRGTHACPGQHLARRELKVFVEEWLTRVPEYEVRPGSVLEVGAGHVGSLRKLDLVWPAKGGSS